MTMRPVLTLFFLLTTLAGAADPSPEVARLAYAFSVAAGILPAVEPGILPGGMSVWFERPTSIAHLESGRQDASFYGSQDGRRYGPYAGNSNMQKRGGQLIYSPSDLIRFLDSPYASWMERLHLEFPDRVQPDEETAEQRLVANTGEKHETNYLQHVERSGKEVFRVPRGDTAEAKRITLEAITAGHDIIYQARLELVPFVGFADFLLRSPDSKGPFYEVCDTKLARSVKPYYLVQLCAYG